MKATPMELTYERKQQFLYNLAKCGNVSQAAATAGIPPATLYKARKRDPEFAEDWEDALAEGLNWQPRCADRRRRTLTTPEVAAALETFSRACERAILASGMSQTEAAGKLSGLLSDLWNYLEAATLKLPEVADE